ncbi:MAG: asparagine synthetase B [Brevinematia bacterium]
MDTSQANHLKAYGLVYKSLSYGYKVKWLLNYRGGSFVILADDGKIKDFALTRLISVEDISESSLASIENSFATKNQKAIELTVAPKIAVYAPPWNMPWDDAVTLVLNYAEIPYSRIWDEEILAQNILENENFDWLHLHHEDFTGQHGKFWFAYGNENWYKRRETLFHETARKLGFNNIQNEKKAIAQKIKKFVENGGFLFAMCAATDTLDIALATAGIDIIPPEIDGTPIDKDFEKKIDFKETMAFKDFKLYTSPYIYEFSDIDIDPAEEGILTSPFYFELEEFSVEYDTIPGILIQNHTKRIKGFLGQTTGFRLEKLKENIIILNRIPEKNWVTYICGEKGKGFFSFLGGHDPEDYSHKVGDPPTNLELYPNSPGYRLILNNVFLPASKEKKKKT